MFFPFSSAGLTQHGNGMYNGQEIDISAIKQLPVYDSLRQPYTLVTSCDPFRDYVQLFSSSAETHKRNCLKLIDLQMMRMVQSGVRRPLSIPFMEVDGPSAFCNARVAKPPLIESDQGQNQRLHFMDKCQTSKHSEENKVTPQEESGEEPITQNMNLNKISNKNKSNQYQTHNITIIQGENGLNYLDPTKKDIETKNKQKKMIKRKRQKVSNCAPDINNEEPNPNLSTIKKRRFVIKKAVHRFSPEEDERLKELVKCFGESSWSRIAKEMPGLNRKQIRDRYVNYLRKERLITEFTAEEDKTILRLVKEKGKRWSIISEELIGRTPIMVKNRFYATLISTPDINLNSIPTIDIHAKPKPKQISKRNSRDSKVI